MFEKKIVTENNVEVVDSSKATYQKPLLRILSSEMTKSNDDTSDFGASDGTGDTGGS